MSVLPCHRVSYSSYSYLELCVALSFLRLRKIPPLCETGNIKWKEDSLLILSVSFFRLAVGVSVRTHSQCLVLQISRDPSSWATEPVFGILSLFFSEPSKPLTASIVQVRLKNLLRSFQQLNASQTKSLFSWDRDQLKLYVSALAACYSACPLRQTCHTKSGSRQGTVTVRNRAA